MLGTQRQALINTCGAFVCANAISLALNPATDLTNIEFEEDKLRTYFALNLACNKFIAFPQTPSIYRRETRSKVKQRVR